MKRKPTDAERARAAEIAALCWKKYVRVSDEDDDRVDDRTGEPVNPRCELLRESLRKRGLRERHWSPPITLLRGEEVGWQAAQAEAFSCRGTIGAFYAALYPDGADRWRITCFGGDDTSYERWNMTREKAESVWLQLRDFITIRSLCGRLGFGNR